MAQNFLPKRVTNLFLVSVVAIAIYLAKAADLRAFPADYANFNLFYMMKLAFC
jgi:hypothetical protein